MQFLSEFCFSPYMRSIFCLQHRATKMVDRNCPFKIYYKNQWYLQYLKRKNPHVRSKSRKGQNSPPRTFYVFFLTWIANFHSAVKIFAICILLSTIEICFSCSVRIKFHIKVALFLEGSGKHICICKTPSEIRRAFRPRAC